MNMTYTRKATLCGAPGARNKQRYRDCHTPEGNVRAMPVIQRYPAASLLAVSKKRSAP